MQKHSQNCVGANVHCGSNTGTQLELLKKSSDCSWNFLDLPLEISEVTKKTLKFSSRFNLRHSKYCAFRSENKNSPSDQSWMRQNLRNSELSEHDLVPCQNACQRRNAQRDGRDLTRGRRRKTYHVKDVTKFCVNALRLCSRQRASRRQDDAASPRRAGGDTQRKTQPVGRGLCQQGRPYKTVLLEKKTTPFERIQQVFGSNTKTVTNKIHKRNWLMTILVSCCSSCPALKPSETEKFGQISRYHMESFFYYLTNATR